MSDITPGLFSSTSAFDQANQPKLFSDESIKKIEERVDKISAAMDLDLDSMYQRLDEALMYINDPAATRLVEDVRDEIYRNLR
jgi:hypothetical protein